MDYPTGFPHHLEPTVDEAIATAEVDFLKAKRGLPSWGPFYAEPLITAFVEPVFFAFAHQMCKAVEERCPGWNQERVRRELERWLTLLIVHVWKDKHPHPEFLHREFVDKLIKRVKNSENWSDLQTELKRVAIVLQRAHPATEESERPLKNAASVAESSPTLSDKLDEIVQRDDISHEELASKIHLGRTTYFEVKAGRGGRKAKKKIEVYVSSWYQQHTT